MSKHITILAALLAMVVAGSALAANTARVVSTAKNAKLGATVLVTLKGHTLYSLSVERKGRFICTDKTCLSLWHPLVVKAGVTPTGAKSLATVRRPDGRRQVTYRGGPLYTFSGDQRRGDSKGEGFKDVGVWRAASVGAAVPSATTTTGGGGGYYP